MLHIHHLLHDYTPISDVLSMETFSNQRYSLGIKCLNDLLSGKVATYLSGLINFGLTKNKK